MNAFAMLMVLAVGAATRPTSSPSSQPSLPPGASSLHPGYSFVAIDPKWHASTLYLDIANDRGVLPTDPGPKDHFFAMVNYSQTEESPPLKEIEFFPSGRVFTETDMHVNGIDFIARGDVYRRAFRDDGVTICFYRHDHDGKCSNGFSITPDGRREQVTNGGGTLTEPGDRGKPLRHFFADGGYELMHREGDDLYLADSWGQWHRKADGTEELSRANADRRSSEEWKRSRDGTITGPRGGEETDSQQKLTERFETHRKDFFRLLSQSTNAAGFTLRDMGIDPFASGPTTKSQ